MTKLNRADICAQSLRASIVVQPAVGLTEMAPPPRSHRPLAAGALRFVLVTTGIVLLAYAGALQTGWLSTSKGALPAPVALQLTAPLQDADTLRLAPSEDPAPALEGLASDAAAAFDADLSLTLDLASPIAREGNTGSERPPTDLTGPRRAQVPATGHEASSSPDIASWLSIPAIDLEASVVAGGAVPNAAGEPEWQTLPFVAVHYANDTALIGASGNAVIAGHVVTLDQGNVFRNLYRVVPGNRVAVRVESGAIFAYEVSSVRLVSPGAIEVMDGTRDPELTLITCGGAFDQRTRSFDQRLVVVARLLGSASA